MYTLSASSRWTLRVILCLVVGQHALDHLQSDEKRLTPVRQEVRQARDISEMRTYLRTKLASYYSHL